jgi:hypothetical protein
MPLTDRGPQVRPVQPRICPHGPIVPRPSDIPAQADEAADAASPGRRPAELRVGEHPGHVHGREVITCQAVVFMRGLRLGPPRSCRRLEHLRPQVARSGAAAITAAIRPFLSVYCIDGRIFGGGSGPGGGSGERGPPHPHGARTGCDPRAAVLGLYLGLCTVGRGMPGNRSCGCGRDLRICRPCEPRGG